MPAPLEILKTLTKEWFEEKYIDEKLSIRKIAKLLGCSTPAVCDCLKKYDIQTRTISQALIGRKLDPEHAEKNRKNLLIAGKKRIENGLSDKEKKRLGDLARENAEKRIGSHLSEETKEKISKAHKGKKLSKEHCEKIAANTRKRFEDPKNHPLYGKHREDMMGSKHFNWNGGSTEFCRKVRGLLEYKLWRTACFERDNYTCQICGQMGGKLCVDHVKMYALILKENNIETVEEALDCQELWDLDNGRTLCVECHKVTPTFSARGKKQLKIIEKQQENNHVCSI